MTNIDLDISQLNSLLSELCAQSRETEWLEFKLNGDVLKIGKYISGLSNSAALVGRCSAYMVFGVDDDTHAIVGTNFNPFSAKYKNQEIESWLLQNLEPKINFKFYEILKDDKKVVILEIDSAIHEPVKFSKEAYVRIGSYLKSLSAFPDKERELWRVFDRTPYELRIALSNVSSEKLEEYLNFNLYFKILNMQIPSNIKTRLDLFCSEGFIVPNDSKSWNITNLGALLFANNLNMFRNLFSRVVRIVKYEGKNKLKIEKDVEVARGYADFNEICNTLSLLLPSKQSIIGGFRETEEIFPFIAVRELVANALIHQDLSIEGKGPIIEIFDDRVDVTNLGKPLVDVLNMLNYPAKCRNDRMATFLRKVKICEQLGTGIDKVVAETEKENLPPPKFLVTDYHTVVTFYSHKPLADMDKDERIMACYLHCCLCYANNEIMNNFSLRKRFGLGEKNKAQVSRIISETVKSKLIKMHDPNVGVRAIRYIPFWA